MSFLRIAVATLFLSICFQSHADEISLAEYKARPCASDVTAPVRKTEAGDCLECLEKKDSSLGKIEATLTPISEKIPDQAEMQKELDFYKSLNPKLDLDKKMTMERMQIELETSKLLGISDSDKKVMADTIGKLAEAIKGKKKKNIVQVSDISAAISGVKNLRDIYIKTLKKLAKATPYTLADDGTLTDKNGKAVEDDMEDVQLPPEQAAAIQLSRRTERLNNFLALTQKSKTISASQIISTHYGIHSALFGLQSEDEIKETEKEINLIKEQLKNSAIENDTPEKRLFADLARYRDFYQKDAGVKDPSDPKYCGMSLVEITAISHYTGSGYSALNGALRGNDENKKKKYEAYRDVLNSALKKLRPFEGKVLRGASLPEDLLAAHQPGAVITYQAFTSTSATRAFGSSQTFVIRSRSGHLIAPFSNIESEDEVLFPSGTKFKVLSVDKKEFGNSEIVMEEVAD